jgi:hypothetical protein
MKIDLRITVDIDPKEWAEREGVTLAEVPDDVRSFFLHVLMMTHAMSDVNGRAWVRESTRRPVAPDPFGQPPRRFSNPTCMVPDCGCSGEAHA